MCVLVMTKRALVVFVVSIMITTVIMQNPIRKEDAVMSVMTNEFFL